MELKMLSIHHHNKLIKWQRLVPYSMNIKKINLLSLLNMIRDNIKQIKNNL